MSPIKKGSHLGPSYSLSGPSVYDEAGEMGQFPEQADDFYVYYIRVAGSRSAEAWIKDGNRFVGGYYRHPRNDVLLICSRNSPAAQAAIVQSQAL